MIELNEPISMHPHPPELFILVEKKITFFQDLLQKTIMYVQKNKIEEILGLNEVKLCIESLHDISKRLNTIIIQKNMITSDSIIAELQAINNDLSAIMRTYGSNSLDDLLSVCFNNIDTDKDMKKVELLRKYFHPTSYKVISEKERDKFINKNKDKEKEKDKDKEIGNLECRDLSLESKPFLMKVHGIKVYIHDSLQKKTLVIYGLVDDIHIDLLNNTYIQDKQKRINENLPNDAEFHSPTFSFFLSALTLKEYLIFNHTDIYAKYMGYLNQEKIISLKPLPATIKDFMGYDLFLKRNMLIHLLMNKGNYENKYLAYLLYDLLTNDSGTSIDSREQILIFDSFSWPIKTGFQYAMKNTIQYTNSLYNFDMNKIPLEQQICLLKAPDSVKEKAMIKLKELKAKSEDSGSKARQYLEGLLKIPFHIYIVEPILTIMDKTKCLFKEMLLYYPCYTIPIKDYYTTAEISSYCKLLFNNSVSNEKIHKYLITCKKPKLLEFIHKINEFIANNKEVSSIKKIKYSHKKTNQLIESIQETIIGNINNNQLSSFIKEIIPFINDPNPTISAIDKNFKEVSSYISSIKSTLDKAVHGHDQAKIQIERIIAQWINGELDGYCFGFEGPPGVGKTSLAKRGLSACLQDASGNNRPFSMIQMGGDSNGSSLHGHNYTYVGSTWGGILQILIDKKCMNPIIFIDEVDKISKTENGKEIVGILTHLLDSTQNDCFQDKYFSGIDLDLSKALFILSYNDVDAIDKVLLDRIHRIKFNNLSLEEKLVILKTHILPETYKKMGVESILHFDDKVLTFIIEEYTAEPGVRKLKELIFDIVGEINLDMLKHPDIIHEFPIEITLDDIVTKYLKEKPEVRIKQIPTTNQFGIANGMYANALGQGGIIPVQAKFFPSNKFLDIKITGLVGDVMNESCNVALSLAWELTPKEQQKAIYDKYAGSSMGKYGIHMNFPEGSVNKNGPSAGSCITSVIYSLLNERKIKCNVAMTGEISLDGCITAIGGLDYKILGSIKSGVTEFIYPKENAKDAKKIMDKYKDTKLLEGIKFHPVDNIHEVFEFIF